MTHHAVGVVAHISRYARAQRLAEKVEAKAVAVDGGHTGPVKNHLLCWRELYRTFPGSKWLVVLEDDALPVEDFRKQLRLMLDASPRPIVSLYLGRTRPGYWQPSIAQAFGRIALTEEDPCFFDNLGLLHAVGVAMKTSLVPLMLDSVSQQKDIPIDDAIDLWSAKRGYHVAYCNPSLVDHDDRIETLIHGNRTQDQPRIAWRTGTRETWDDTTMHVSHVPVSREALIVQ